MTDPLRPLVPSVLELLDVLDLEELGQASVIVSGAPGDTETELGESTATVFLGQSQRMPHGRVYGGQVLAQSVVAAGRSVHPADDPRHRALHSFNAYFIRPGDDNHPIRFSVERLMDGRSFSIRRVHAIQYGQVILSLTASFQVPSDGVEHQDPMPAVPPPEALAPGGAGPRAGETAQALADPMVVAGWPTPVEMRPLQPSIRHRPSEERVSHQQMWLRCLSTLPDDPLIHAAILAYISDFTMIEPVLRRHGIFWRDPRLRAASLDHAMWFHRAARADEWLLFDGRAPSGQGGRGLGTSRLFTRDGKLVASVAQEGMIRLRALPPEPSPPEGTPTSSSLHSGIVPTAPTVEENH